MGDSQVVTASAVISFAKKLEESLVGFYRELAEQFPDEQETFLGLAKACEKSRVSVERTYRETISDALEAGFSFEGLQLSEYVVEEKLTRTVDFGEALDKGIDLEETAANFYQDVAKRSRALLATIAMGFASAAKMHKKHKDKLQSLR